MISNFNLMYMELEKQVVSLELAKKLKELGVNQQSYFSWYRGIGGIYLGDETEVMNAAVSKSETTAPQFEKYSAYTVAELCSLLPETIEHSGEQHYIKIKKMDNEYGVNFETLTGYYCIANTGGDTMADALAEMLVYLIKNGYVDPKELNVCNSQ